MISCAVLLNSLLIQWSSLGNVTLRIPNFQLPGNPTWGNTWLLFFIESSRSFFHGLEGGLSSASHLSAIGSEAKWGVNVGLSMIGALQIQLLFRYPFLSPLHSGNEACWGYRIRQTFGKRSVGPGCLHTCEPLDSRDGLSSWRWSANCEKLEYLRGDERRETTVNNCWL